MNKTAVGKCKSLQEEEAAVRLSDSSQALHACVRVYGIAKEDGLQDHWRSSWQEWTLSLSFPCCVLYWTGTMV